MILRLSMPVLAGAFLLACSTGPPPEPPAPAEAVRSGEATALTARVDAYLAPYIEADLFQGVVLIARGDEVLVHRAYGPADAEAGIPSDLDTKFRIASLTKTFTSGAILTLRARGLLTLDDALIKYVEGFSKEITIGHLLAHASGLAEPDDSLGDSEEVALADLVENIRARPLLFAPGSDNRYSNAGYNTLARVIERVSGKGYDDFLRETFFIPLRMSHTGHFGTDESAPGHARGYTPGPAPSRLIRTPLRAASAMLGSGSLSSTAADLHRWGRAVARKELFSLDDLRWPYGWGKIETGAHKGIWQTGGNTGFVSSLSVFPAEEVVIVCLNNIEAGAWVQWGKDLAALVFDEKVEPPLLTAEIAVEPDRLDACEGTYRSEQGDTYRAVNEGGLFLYFNDRRVGKYLTPIGEGRFQPRSDAGIMRFEPDASGRPARLVWDFGDSSLIFARVP